jgi:hypothetical protein
LSSEPVHITSPGHSSDFITYLSLGGQMNVTVSFMLGKELLRFSPAHFTQQLWIEGICEQDAEDNIWI